ncbi:MAG: hypothetical protein KGY99_09290 [Phycisphaerae bacterium]|nr:hypothetical protein [Phycisphaerae bacterium]
MTRALHAPPHRWESATTYVKLITAALLMLLGAAAATIGLLDGRTPARPPATRAAGRSPDTGTNLSETLAAAESQPATRAAPYPAPALAAACEVAAERLRDRLPPDYVFIVRPPFVVAGRPVMRTGGASVSLERIVSETIVRAARAMWASYFRHRPTRPVVALLFPDAAAYMHWAGALFGDTDLPKFGYCRRDGVLVMNIATGTGTLIHELTHALIAPDFRGVPTWFNEGLACLHEQCRIGDDRIIGLCNWRLPALQTAVAAGRLRPLRELVTARDFRGRLEGLNYAQARYFVQYLQHRGLLHRFYRTLRRLHAVAGRRPDEGSVDVHAIETVCGADIDVVDASWRRWVMQLRYGG